jgi:ferredoxin
LVGIMIILGLSRRQGKMIHCTVWCPIGTLVNYLRFINPFRMYIDDNCTECGLCTKYCRYDALNLKDIHNKKPGITCTLCGDCVTSCHTVSLKYKFFNIDHHKARHLYLIITVSLHALFLALARL